MRTSNRIITAATAATFAGFIAASASGQTVGLEPDTLTEYPAGFWTSTTSTESIRAALPNPLGLSASFADDDAASFDIDTSGTPVTVNSLIGGFRGGDAGFPSGDLLGLHVEQNGTLTLAFDTSGAAFGGTSFSFNPLTGSSSVLFDPGVFGEEADAVSRLSNGDLLFSTSSAGTLPAGLSATGASVSINDGDVLQINSNTGLISVLLTEAEIFVDNFGDLSGIHVLDDNTLLFTADTDEVFTGRPETILDEQAIALDLTTKTSLGLYFDGRDAYSGSHDLDALFYSATPIAIPAPGAAAALLMGISGAMRRRR